MITPLMEMLELPNFGHMATSTIEIDSRSKILLETSWTEIVTSSSQFQNTFILRTLRVTNFADIIKATTMFIKKIFIDSKKVKRISNYVLKCDLYLYFLI